MKNKSMFTPLISLISATGFALALMGALNAQAAPAQAADSKVAPARLDAPLTSANSYLQDFGYGVILRLPRSLEPTLDFDHINQPVKAEAIAMTFLFPDMVQTEWASPMEIIFEQQRGIHRPPQKDRFPVNIVWMFYTPPESDNFSSGPQPPFRFEPRPPRILLNLGSRDPKPPLKPTFVNSKYAGIREARFQVDKAEAERYKIYHDKQIELAKKNGWDLSKGNSPAYVEKPGSSYELYMACSSECLAHVYSKRSHFQYRMNFAPEAVAHTDELIRAINTMIDQWVVPQQTQGQH
jgi:hypothetical protein